MPVNKIHNFFAIFIVSFSLLCFLVGLILFYNYQSERVKSLAFESMTLLSEWNKLENESYALLLKRFTQFGNETSTVISSWEQQYLNFERNLDNLMKNPLVKRQSEISERLEGASRVWRFTEVRLNNASHYFSQIIQSGLGEKVMVNGMLHTMYQMRMEEQLGMDEICLLEDTIYALDNLNNAADEFDYLFSSIVFDMNSAGDTYLKRIRMSLVALFCSAAVIIVVSILINRQLRTAQFSRRIYLKSQKEHLLCELCRNSSEEELDFFRTRQSEYGISLSVDEPVLIIMFQIDNFKNFSNQYNIAEQQKYLDAFCSDFSSMLDRHGFNSECFIFEDDYIIFMLNVDESADPSLIEDIVKKWHSNMEQRHVFTVSVTMSDICFDNQDLDHDFEYIRSLSEYRYLMGYKAFIIPGAFIMPEARNICQTRDFRYPLEKERRFEDAFKSLNTAEALDIMSEMIKYAEPFSPISVKRLVLRLTASISSVVELLEKTYHASVATGVTPMIFAIQKMETLDEATEMLEGIIKNMIAACRKMKTEKHDQTVVMVKDIIEKEIANFNLSADYIADKFNLTASYINRLFKKHTSLSIAGYINECRLKKAEELLRNTDETIAQIAEMSGFSSMGTFFRLFKKKHGQTPGEMASGLNRE